MSARLLPHRAKAVRYWWVAARAPDQWCGFLIEPNARRNTRTEVGSRELVLEAIKHQRQFVGLPVHVSDAASDKPTGTAA